MIGDMEMFVETDWLMTEAKNIRGCGYLFRILEMNKYPLDVYLTLAHHIMKKKNLSSSKGSDILYRSMDRISL